MELRLTGRTGRRKEWRVWVYNIAWAGVLKGWASTDCKTAKRDAVPVFQDWHLTRNRQSSESLSRVSCVDAVAFKLLCLLFELDPLLVGRHI